MHHGAILSDGRQVTRELLSGIIGRTVDALRNKVPHDPLSTAVTLYNEMISTGDFAEFLTLRAYQYLD